MMGEQIVAIFCFWGGTIIQTEDDVKYEGSYRKALKVPRAIKFSELVDKLYDAMNMERHQFRLAITGRYPFISGRTETKHMAMKIDDDECLDLMFRAIGIMLRNHMELYVESEEIMVTETEAALLTRDTGTPPLQSPVCDTAAETHFDGMCGRHAPDPTDGEHRSMHIWQNASEQLLRCRIGANTRDICAVSRHRKVLHYLEVAGFYGFFRLGTVQLNWPLITSLVERWRPETHTFHFEVGEATITLQDVGILSGLRVDGDPVTGTDHGWEVGVWQDLFKELLGVAPPENEFVGNHIHLSWLTRTFGPLPSEATDDMIQCHTRALIYMMIGAHLLTNKTGGLVPLMYLPLLRDLEHCGRLSWGAAGLACLYRNMCRVSLMGAKELAGPLVLLQIWAWERLPQFRPTIREPPKDFHVQGEGDDLSLPPYGHRWTGRLSRCPNSDTLRQVREKLQFQVDEQMTWQPYTPQVLQALPQYCLHGKHIWCTRSPLICFDMIEMHLPDRVMRQFGMRQEIPSACNTRIDLHYSDRRGRPDYDWALAHNSFIADWAQRLSHVQKGTELVGRLDVNDPYLQWYWTVMLAPVSPSSDVPAQGSRPIVTSYGLMMKNWTKVHKIVKNIIGTDDINQAHVYAVEIKAICNTIVPSTDDEVLFHRPESNSQPATLQENATTSKSQAVPVAAPTARKRRGCSTIRREGNGRTRSPKVHKAPQCVPTTVFSTALLSTINELDVVGVDSCRTLENADNPAPALSLEVRTQNSIPISTDDVHTLVVHQVPALPNVSNGLPEPIVLQKCEHRGRRRKGNHAEQPSQDVVALPIQPQVCEARAKQLKKVQS